MKIRLTNKYFIEVTRDSFLLKEYGSTGKDIVGLYPTLNKAVNGAGNLILMEEAGEETITLEEYQYRLESIKEDLMTGVYEYEN